MIKGLDNIYKAINTLGGLMAETVSTLRFIEGKTNTMCEELFNISSDIARMNANVTGHLTTISDNISSVNSNLGTISDNQQTISAELKYSRYANEAIRANSDRMVWYTEQRRQGLI